VADVEKNQLEYMGGRRQFREATTTGDWEAIKKRVTPP
jgi:hypothetical protein